MQGETYHNPVIIVDQSDSPPSHVLIKELKNDQRVDVREVSSDFDASWENLRSREVSALILIPPALGPAAGNGVLDITLTVYADEAEPAVRASVMTAVNAALGRALQSSGAPVQVTVESKPVWGAEELSGLDISLTAVIGFVIMFLVLLMSLLLLVRESMEGTKARFYAAPVNRRQIIGGYVMGMTFFALLIFTVVLFMSIVIFGAAVRGSLLPVIGLVVLFSIGTIMLAILLSRLARNEFQTVRPAPMIALPSLALSGFLVPVQTLPVELQAIAKFIPLTYAIDGLKTIMVRGGGVGDIMMDVAALVIFTVVVFVGAVLVTKETVA